MKTLHLIIALFALFIALKGGKVIIFPGDNILVYRDSVGVVYDADMNVVTRIPADMILGIGAINDSELKPEVEM